jgi:hypothetical protein
MRLPPFRLSVAGLTVAALCACHPDTPADPPAAPTGPTTPTASATDALMSTATAAAPTMAASTLDAAVGAADTIESLRARHGAANLRIGKVPGAEGEEFDGWILYPDDPARRAYVYLDDKGRPEVVRILDQESTWQRSDGIRMNLGLDDLARRNGKPIDFSGFGWDYGGNISSWNGGTMEKQLADGGFGLCPPEFPDDQYPPGYPEGEGTFSSTLPIVVAHPPVVCTFAVIVGERAR